MRPYLRALVVLVYDKIVTPVSNCSLLVVNLVVTNKKPLNVSWCIVKLKEFFLRNLEKVQNKMEQQKIQSNHSPNHLSSKKVGCQATTENSVETISQNENEIAKEGKSFCPFKL